MKFADLHPAKPLPELPGAPNPDGLTRSRLAWLVAAFLVVAALPCAWAWRVWGDFGGPLSYQPLIPFVAGYLVWSRREEVALTRREIAALFGRESPKLRGGVGGVAAGCLLLAFAHTSKTASLGVAALVLIVAGTVHALYGPYVLRILRAPLAFLLTMVPLPDPVLARATQFFQLWSADVAGNVLAGVLGIKNQVMGSTILIGDHRLEVEQACSGMAVLFPVLSLTLALLILNRSRFGVSAILMLFALVVSMAMNVLRVTAMGVVGEQNPVLAQRLHDLNSWLFTVLAVGVTYALAHRLKVRLVPYEEEYQPALLFPVGAAAPAEEKEAAR